MDRAADAPPPAQTTESVFSESGRFHSVLRTPAPNRRGERLRARSLARAPQRVWRPESYDGLFATSSFRMLPRRRRAPPFGRTVWPVFKNHALFQQFSANPVRLNIVFGALGKPTRLDARVDHMDVQFRAAGLISAQKSVRAARQQAERSRQPFQLTGKQRVAAPVHRTRQIKQHGNG